jgi:Ca2+:H+ antiporter
MKFIYILLIFIPATFIERYILHTSEGIIFVTSALAIVPLAVLIGNATEQIAIYTGPKIGGFLNATMGNVPELLISGFAIKAGLYSLVLASLAGSIIGNILLVMGFSIFVGGLKFKFQEFNKNIMRTNFALLGFAAFSIIIPFAFNSFSEAPLDKAAMGTFSLGLAIILLVVYIVGLVFSMFTHKDIFHDAGEDDEEKEEPQWKFKTGVAVLLASTVFVALMSETLVATVEVAADQFSLSQAFIGIILIPILGNVAEHASAVIMAYKGKLDISIEIAAGSSMQIALFVTPLMVIFSAFLGDTMPYIYTQGEILGIVVGIFMAGFVLMDQKTNWLEGFQLIVAYVVLGAAFLFFGV